MIRLFPNRGGWLEVVCGPMFSGKSEELIRRLRRAEIAGQRVLIVKPRIDNRYDIGHVVSHAGARMRAVAVDDPADIPGLVDGYDVVGVDEVQFFPPQITLVLDGLVEGGMRIIACGLDQDFRGFPFAAMPELLCRARAHEAAPTSRASKARTARSAGETALSTARSSVSQRAGAPHPRATPWSARTRTARGDEG